MSTRILVVDDHDVVRQGVRLILRARAEWQVVGEAESGAEAIEKTKALDPDLLVLDISMPGTDGLAVVAALSKLKVRSKILVLTMHESKELAAVLQKTGASGYVIKTHAARDLVRAIQEVLDGGEFFPAEPPASTEPQKETAKMKKSKFLMSAARLAPLELITFHLPAWLLPPA